MIPTSRHLNPWVLFLPGTLIILMVILGVVIHSAALLSVGLVAGLVLVLTYLFADAAHLHAIEVTVASLASEVEVASRRADDVEIELAALKDRLAGHLARCRTHDLDDALIEIARPRSA